MIVKKIKCDHPYELGRSSHTTEAGYFPNGCAFSSAVVLKVWPLGQQTSLTWTLVRMPMDPSQELWGWVRAVFLNKTFR